MLRIVYSTVIAILTAVVALAATATTSEGEAGQSRLRLVYLSSDSPTVDFYIDGQKALSSIGYRTITNYMEISLATHDYEVRRAGSPADSPPVAQVATGSLDAMKATGLDDALPPNPPADHCNMRFFHAALGVPNSGGPNADSTGDTDKPAPQQPGRKKQ